MSQNIWSFIEPSMKSGKENLAWICREKQGKKWISYAEIYQATLTLAAKLRKHGIQCQDTVGITAPNGPEWTIAALACWKIGAKITPIHIGNSEHDISIQIQAATPKLMLIYDTEMNFQNTLKISLESDPSVASIEAQQRCIVKEHDVAVRIYTSGSTDSPKMVRLSHENLISNVLAACHIEHFDATDKFIALLPFSHAMGLMANLLLPCYTNSCTVLPQSLTATEILNTLNEENISVMVAVPKLYRNIMLGLEKKFDNTNGIIKAYVALIRKSPIPIKKILNNPIKKKLGGKIKAWVSGGSHLDGEISRYYHALGFPLRQGYGLTETSPLVSMQDNFDSSVESVGKPIQKVEVKLTNSDEKGNGELWVKGPNVMLGYEDKSQNKDVLKNGWFKTGDIARLDNTGKITLTGRSKRLIVTEAGKNVYPEELETLLERNGLIKEAVVFELKKTPVCILVIQGEDSVSTAKQCIKQFNELVSSHNRISRFALVDELPRTPFGKLALQKMPEIFADNEWV